MGLFKKKEIEGHEEVKQGSTELPKLPELPKIEGSNDSLKPIHQLPSFPSNSLGEEFSQNTIKEAVAGGKEGEEDFYADDFEEEDQMMQKPLTRTQEIPTGFEEAAKKVRKAEPVFIRLDKFEESLHLFEKTKKQITEIETMLSDIKKTKEHEEKELAYWEKEMQSMKSQIERVDKDIFSKVE